MYQRNLKIEIELNENQIMNTHYDVQSFNDNETSSSNSDNRDVQDLLLPMMRIRRRKMTKEKK